MTKNWINTEKPKPLKPTCPQADEILITEKFKI